MAHSVFIKINRPDRRPGLLAIISNFALAFLLVACSGTLPFKPTITPTLVGTLEGQLLPWIPDTPIVGRKIVLCQSIGDSREGNCRLLKTATISASDGTFTFTEVPAGTYFVMYDSGLGDFDAALDRWGGEILHFNDQAWMSAFLGVDLENTVPVFRIPEGLNLSPNDEWLRCYCALTLLVGNSPFIIAHNLELAMEEQDLRCQIITVRPGETSEITIQAIFFPGSERGVA